MYLNGFFKAMHSAWHLLTNKKDSPAENHRKRVIDPALKNRILMRINLITIIITIALLQAHANSYSQVTIHLKNVEVQSVFKSIEQQSKFTVLYDSEDIKGMSKVTVDVNNGSIEDVLNQSFKSLPLTYKIIAQTVLVKKAAKVPEKNGHQIVQSADSLKKITVTGLITDEKKTPLIGVTVFPEGARTGVTSSSDGRFTITFSSFYKSLVFSYIGMKPKKVPVTGPNMLVTLEFVSTALSDVVVVSDGYTTLPKERAAGAYGIVTAKEIEGTPSISLMERLEGKVAGVRFDVANNRIQIRGTSDYSSTQPLIVVDGFPLIPNAAGNQTLTNLTSSPVKNNSLYNAINPDDIEQITFLKDATATSLYGSAAANGVIVITTKRGRRNDPTINLSVDYGVSAAPSLSKLHWMSSAQYINLEQEMVDKGFITAVSGVTPYPPNSDAQAWMLGYQNGSVSLGQRDSALKVLSSRNNTKQIEQYLLQKAVNKQYNFSVSGGSDHNTYYLSANYNNDVPIYRGNSASNYAVTANITSDLLKNILTLRTGINYNYSSSISNTAAATALGYSSLSLRPYDMLVDPNGNSINHYFAFNQAATNSLTAQGYLPWTYNPIDELNYSDVKTTLNQLRFNAALNGKVTNWLSVEVSGSYQEYTGASQALDELNSYSARSQINTATSVASDGSLVYGIPVGGILNLNNSQAHDYSLRGQFNVDKVWNNINHFYALAGTEIRETYSKAYGDTRYGYDQNTGTFQAVNPTVPYTVVYPGDYSYQTTLDNPVSSIIENKNRYLDYFANASYALMDKYIITSSIRFDDANIIGLSRSQRAKPFYSAGLKWNMKRENFMKDVKPVDDLSLRLTYGKEGTVPAVGSPYTIINVGGVDYKTQQPYATITTPGNIDLTWETSRMLNSGLDFSIFTGRLSGSFDIYQKWSSGIAQNVPFNSTYGWSYLTFNTATLKGHGVDLGLSGKIIRSKDWGWTSDLNFSYNTNKVTDARFTNTASSIVGSASPVVGLPLDYLYVYRWAGLDNTGESQVYDRNGKIINSDISNNTLTVADLKYAGRTTPPYFGGFFNTFRYKNFELNTQITYYLGYVFLKQSISNYPTYVGTYYGVIGRQEDLANRWEKPGDQAKTNVPGLSNINENSITRYQFSDLLVRSADNIRLQQVSLSYKVPAQFIKKVGFKSLSVSANARNLGMLWAKNKEGIDPSYPSTANYSNLPPTKNYVLGLNASF